ncbi:hypothetical protein [Paramicrobacterium chengjingii]|uniref:EF-hand domain-containing protein n=1 Tax=Paramicrobacterium chengjingii TaxID=2769067 RepID=A0ABX6YH35_9MICO|nr:hypothetical protein [Microbacterium chengjingii]QPZ37930.1 hypothetical protein HCR76_14130 [Microbacterium chengjingii]
MYTNDQDVDDDYDEYEEEEDWWERAGVNERRRQQSAAVRWARHRWPTYAKATGAPQNVAEDSVDYALHYLDLHGLIHLARFVDEFRTGGCADDLTPLDIVGERPLLSENEIARLCTHYGRQRTDGDDEPVHDGWELTWDRTNHVAQVLARELGERQLLAELYAQRGVTPTLSTDELERTLAEIAADGRVSFEWFASFLRGYGVSS